MTTSNSNTSGKRPTHRLYLVTGSDENPVWTPIGAAWPNRDGLGYSINCAAIPTDGRIVMRVAKDKTDKRQGQMI